MNRTLSLALLTGISTPALAGGVPGEGRYEHQVTTVEEEGVSDYARATLAACLETDKTRLSPCLAFGAQGSYELQALDPVAAFSVGLDTVRSRGWALRPSLELSVGTNPLHEKGLTGEARARLDLLIGKDEVRAGFNVTGFGALNEVEREPFGGVGLGVVIRG